MSKSIRVITSKQSLYTKLNSLHFKKEIELEKDETKYINKILKNINFKQLNIIKEKRDGKTILKKINPVKLQVYLKKNFK